jgi:hypothetical protein
MGTITKVFKFLEHNHQWNEAFQAAEYKKCLTHCMDAKERLNALLHMIAHTQSSPKLGKLGEFWKKIETAPWKKNGFSLLQLTEYLEQINRSGTNSLAPWKRLFYALSNVDGWGPKTAALFVKCVIRLHRSEHSELHFLSDIESAYVLGHNDQIYLPVDAVILRIFRESAFADMGKSFYPINAALQRERYTAEDMLVWDDLWFWGFFSQNSSGSERTFGWNAARFWGQLSAEGE